jgi:preprotein translocase subunit SecB
MSKDKQETQAPSKDGPVFTIQRIYTKDVSFEAPNTPDIFKAEWKPDVNVDLQTKTNPLEDGIYEVILHLTVTVKMQDKNAFLIEVHQAGIFTLKGFPEQQLGHAIGSMCPNILYPYARETISDIVTRGGFPQLLLAPVNFDALYLQHLEQQKKQGKGDDSAANA